MTTDLPVLLASANGAGGMAAGWEILTSGGNVIDAVEVVACAAEDNADDHTVGYSGYPNLLGAVELDASIMEGASRRAGAVAALAGYRHAVTVARAVMERTPHVCLAGEGAARLASEIGLPREDLLTSEIEQLWRRGVEGKLGSDDSGASMLAKVVALVRDPERVAGTVNVLAIDRFGAMATAVSTSGWAWKYPGRVGDSPFIGCGNYVDNRYGAVTCTGWGELAVRAGAARAAVAAVASGVPLEDACREVLIDMASLEDDVLEIHLHMLGLLPDGSHCALSTNPDAEYVVQTGAMSKYVRRRRALVHVPMTGNRH